ncbi:hypothetical protein M2132_001321 [Dysgonomonas sp. PH5-45]|uniref:DUF6794 domain-containing protein n=1 Tax=unclassified Dysgonomonas TaxID=2630389 RepID=UPI002474C332|nr:MULTISPECIES: DUF6794 domain-containing protein [unclassified Dysgonomonas]MDH6354984.1 hypothetical protein [Dysgonomonas sp. PH5-45]MDH6387892.1 hypothetical protein [Dysgonomonas sp. PH5-37]
MMKSAFKFFLFPLFFLTSAFNVHSQEKINVITSIRYQLDSIDGEYIPYDIYDAFKQIDTFWPDSVKQEVKNMSEEDFSARAHFGFGMWMRNNWALWHGSRFSKYFEDFGIFHPDDMSGIILDSYCRYLRGADIKLDEQILYYKNYWEKVKKDDDAEWLVKRIEYMSKEMVGYERDRAVYYNYPYGFSTEQEEDDYDERKCEAIGKITDVDIETGLIKVKLIKSCNDRGVIIYDTHYYRFSEDENYYDDKGEMVTKKGRKTFYMKENEEFWFYYDERYNYWGIAN